MKVKYIGKSFGVAGLTNGKVYTCLFSRHGHLLVRDDSDDYDYPYHPLYPEPCSAELRGYWGMFEIIEDDKNGSLENSQTACFKAFPQKGKGMYIPKICGVKF